MNETIQTREATGSLSRWMRIAPVIALVLLSPIISELLSGSTRITTIFVLIPEIGIWGCGTLIIRYLVRRQHKGWVAILLLGIALGMAEEFVIQQTSLAPLVGVDPNHIYARWLGVNWVYLLWVLGFECVWVVILPIQLAELIFPDRRDDPWIGRRGLWIASIAFILASFMAWYSWTQVYAPMITHQPAYQPPWISIGIGVAVIAALALGAATLQPGGQARQGRVKPAPRPGVVGVAAFMIAGLWNLLILIAYGALPTLPVSIPILASLLLAGVTFRLIRFWTANINWQDAHRLALVFGTTLATLVDGWIILGVTKALPVDRIGQVAFNLIALFCLILLSRRPQFHQG
jgi:hypothetical protein